MKSSLDPAVHTAIIAAYDHIADNNDHLYRAMLPVEDCLNAYDREYFNQYQAYINGWLDDPITGE